MNRILAIDDDRSVREIVKSALGSVGYDVHLAESAEEGLDLFPQLQPQVVLLDLHLPTLHGFELFRKLIAKDSRTPVIFITADSSSEVVIKAMRMGAFDYLKKPLNVSSLKRMVASAVAARRAADQPVALTVGDLESQEYFVGGSPAMMEVFKAIGRVANQQVPVLIRGESGTGKELVARALVDHGKRSEKPFMSINCAAIPDALLESELFGHEKGAFTGADRRRIGRFEQCDGGTIFLDEIGDMSPIVQGKVLRLIQEQVFERVGGTDVIRTNVRIVAATHQPLEEMVDEGKFRQDLLFRLNGYTINLPPLRNRMDDVPLLIELFLRRAKVEMDRQELTGLSKDALEALTGYNWPGNVRELQSVVRQALLNCVGAVITRECLPESVLCATTEVVSSVESSNPSKVPSPQLVSARPESDFSLHALILERFNSGSKNVYSEVIAEVERLLFTKILQLTDGNQSRASEVLGITRGKIRDRIAAFGIKLDTTISVEDPT
ncbi:MAG: sigma-54 dependent transcriptional regulator [Pirellulales bacterium]